MPDGFRISIKAPRTITHYKKLNDTFAQVRSFFYRISSLLGYKCGSHLFHLPASFCFDAENLGILAQFISLLDPGRYNVFEFRQADWWNGERFDLLISHGVCFCAVDGFGLPDIVTPGGDYPALARIIVSMPCRRIYEAVSKENSGTPKPRERRSPARQFISKLRIIQRKGKK
jgi:hypothetical protein